MGVAPACSAVVAISGVDVVGSGGGGGGGGGLGVSPLDSAR